MSRTAKQPKRTVPPPIQPEALYYRADLRLFFPWLGDVLLAQLKATGKIKYRVVPDGRAMERHAYLGRDLLAWVATFRPGEGISA